MSSYGPHPSLHRTTEPVDWGVWHWFICNGPHGERFTWHHDSDPRCTSDIQRLQRKMAEGEAGNPGFIEKALLIAREALSNEDPVIVLKGIQVLTAFGSENDLAALKPLISHADARVQKHSRAGLFERGIKLRRTKT